MVWKAIKSLGIHLFFLYCQACFVQVLSIGSKSAHEQRSSADMFMCIHSHVLLHNYRSRVVCAHTHDNVPCMFVQVHMGCVFVLLFCQEPMASLGGQCGGEGLSVVEGHCRREHRLELWQWHRQKQLQQWQCTGICRDRGHNRSFCGNGSAQSLHRGRDAGWHVSLNHGSCCAKKKSGLAAGTWALISPKCVRQPSVAGLAILLSPLSICGQVDHGGKAQPSQSNGSWSSEGRFGVFAAGWDGRCRNPAGYGRFGRSGRRQAVRLLCRWWPRGP